MRRGAAGSDTLESPSYEKLGAKGLPWRELGHRPLCTAPQPSLPSVSADCGEGSARPSV
jgi:hypothetical protein